MTIALFVAMGLVLLVLVTGLVSMARGGEFNRKNANRLMRARVLFQGIAVVLLLIVLFLQWGG